MIYVINPEYTVARRFYLCDTCDGPIVVGKRFLREDAIDSSGRYEMRTCIPCVTNRPAGFAEALAAGIPEEEI